MSNFFSASKKDHAKETIKLANRAIKLSCKAIKENVRKQLEEYIGGPEFQEDMDYYMGKADEAIANGKANIAALLKNEMSQKQSFLLKKNASRANAMSIEALISDFEEQKANWEDKQAQRKAAFENKKNVSDVFENVLAKLYPQQIEQKEVQPQAAFRTELFTIKQAPDLLENEESDTETVDNNFEEEAQERAFIISESEATQTNSITPPPSSSPQELKTAPRKPASKNSDPEDAWWNRLSKRNAPDKASKRKKM